LAKNHHNFFEKNIRFEGGNPHAERNRNRLWFVGRAGSFDCARDGQEFRRSEE
jgi:hypothetical protein